MKRLILSAQLFVLLAAGTADAQIANNFRIVPPVQRPLYIMQFGADSASYGLFQRLLGDTVVYMGLAGRGRGQLTEMQLPLVTVSRIEMAQLTNWKAASQRGAIFGGISGVAIGGVASKAAGGNPGVPAILGGVIGAGLGHLLGSRSTKGRVTCWHSIYQRSDPDSTRLKELRRLRSDEPLCEAIGIR